MGCGLATDTVPVVVTIAVVTTMTIGVAWQLASGRSINMTRFSLHLILTLSVNGSLCMRSSARGRPFALLMVHVAPQSRRG
jgi:hypothetical protein